MLNFRLFRHLWLFVVVAEEKHFGRAAKRIGMSQPPLTEQIQTLEAALKVRLLERSRRGTTLTAAGAAIYPVARKLADHMQQLEMAVREAAAGQLGVLTIGAISSAMLDVLPPYLDKFRRTHPGITVGVKEIDSVDAAPMLRSGQIDIALARLELIDDAEFGSAPLKDDRLAVALPIDHPLASSTRIRLSALADQNLIMFAREFSPDYFDSLTTACRESDFTPRIVHIVRTVASQVAFVGCGQGVALIPYSMRKLAPPNVAVRPVKEDIRVPTATMVWSKLRPNVLVEQFRAGLSSQVDKPAPGRGKRAAAQVGAR